MTSEKEIQEEKPGKKNGWREWIRLRFHLNPIKKHIVYHKVAKHPWYYGDGATLMTLVGVLVLSGMFMTLTYSPSPERAYASLLQITNDNLFGSFVRGLHYWSAGMTILVLLYHLFRHISLGGYLPPREGIWLIGVVLFFLILTTSFIGYTLRWDERSIYAIGVALNIFYKIPIMGEEMVRFVQGGEQIGANTLSRLYSVHVIFIPLTLLAMIGYHLYLVLTYGATTPQEKIYAPETAEEQIKLSEAEKTDPKTGHAFFPFMVAKTGAVAFTIFLLVVALSLLLGPAPLAPEANLTRAAFPQEEWWFHWYSGVTAYLPPSLSEDFHWLFPIVVFLILVALPFLDHGGNRGAKRRPLAIIAVSLIVSLLLLLTGLRLKSPWTAWPRHDLPPIPAGVDLTPSAHEGRHLFLTYGCFNCHGIGGHGSSFAPNLTGLEHRYSQQELRNFILKPPDGVAMPAYRDRLTEDELQKIVDFILVVQTFPRKY